MANPIEPPPVKVFELFPGLGVAVEPMSISEGEQKGDHLEYTLAFKMHVVKQDERGNWQPVSN